MGEQEVLGGVGVAQQPGGIPDAVPGQWRSKHFEGLDVAEAGACDHHCCGDGGGCELGIGLGNPKLRRPLGPDLCGKFARSFFRSGRWRGNKVLDVCEVAHVEAARSGNRDLQLEAVLIEHR